MKYNELEFFEFEKSTALLLNSVIKQFLIEFKNGTYTATINFKLPNLKDYKILQIFIEELIAFNINQTAGSIYQQIHNYKFLIEDGNYYLCLDPDESSLQLTDQDQDFFMCRKLVAEIK